MLSPHEIRDVCQAGKDRDPGWYRIHRRLSIHVTARLLQTRITLRHISTLMLSLGVVGAALNASPHLLLNALGWACLYGAFLLDKVDGEVARFRREQSVTGILLDRFHHRIVEPLLFLAVGWRAFAATGTPLPLIAAFATMLAANIIEETQHLPAYIAAKFAREMRAWPAPGREPAPIWERAAPWMRSLKTFRTFITVLPLVAGAQVVEALTRLPVTTWLLVTSAIGLWVYVLFQAGHYVAGRLDENIEELTRELPPLPEHPRHRAAPADERPGVNRSDDPDRSERAERSEGGEPAHTHRPRGMDPGPLAVLLLLGLLAGRASAATYFVDGSSAQCSSSGPGTLDQPYCSISAAVAARGTAGNTILVQPGTYREMVAFPVSGTSVAPIVVRANGPGVIIDGADDYSSTSLWEEAQASSWRAASVDWGPLQVFADGVRLTASGNQPSQLPSGTFRYVEGDGLYVNTGGDNPGLHGVRVGRRATAFQVSNRSWITIQGFTATRAEDRGINIKSGSTDIAILDCTVTFANRYGIYVNNGARVRISGNVVTDHHDHGIILTAGSTACVVEDNESARNADPDTRSANGLYLYGSTGNTIRRNRWHHNQDSGQHLQSGSHNNLSYDNVSWSNGDHGYDHLGSSGIRHFNDVAYGNFKDGFSIEGTSPNTELTNCIAVDNGLTSNEFNLWVDAASSVGFASNDNIFWNSTSQPPFKIDKTTYATLAAYQAATGQDSRSLQANPLFVNAPAGDFHVLAGSPAIDNGNSSSPDWPATDASGASRLDDPATPNTGLGPVVYSDRGAHEFRPDGRPPVAELVASPLLTTAPAVVTLDASGSSDPGNSPLSYRFDFGDGTNAGPQASPTVVHTYQAGTFNATVTVINGIGLDASASVTLVSNQRPVASLAGLPVSGRSPLTVSLDASGSSDPDGSVASYTFDFGDGTVVGPQAGATATHVYGEGQWQARVTVADDRGAVSQPSAPLSLSVAPPDRAPVAAAPATVTASEGGTVTVNVTASDPDGDPILQLAPNLSALPVGNDAVFTPAADKTSGQLVWHPGHADSGTYVVTFVAGNALLDTASTLIRVTNSDRAPVVTAPATLRAPTGSPLALIVSAADPDADPIASLTANLASLPAGHGATFTPAGDAKSGVLAWTPAPGDTGQYLLAFTATNALVGSSATMLTVTPPNLPPTAALAVSPQTGNASLNVSANASGSSDPGGGALTYRFDFGDGFVVGPQASPIATHRYGPGQWTLLVSVTDLDGAVSTASTRVTVAATGPGLNLVGNPSFQWNTDRWRRFSATSIGRIAGGFDGNRSLRVAGPANLSTFGIDDSTNWVANTPAIGTHYRFGAWVRSTTAKGSARLQVREFLAGVPIDAGVVSAPLPLTPEWQLVTMELVTRASGSTIDFQVVDEPQAPGEVFDVDNISIHVLPEPASQTPMTTNDPPGGTQNHHGQLGGAPGAPPASAPGAPTDSKPWAPTGATAAPTVPDRFSVSVTPAMAGRGGTLRFATTVAGPVRVELYDLSGRRVRRLLDDPFMAPGLRELTLDGRGDQGERLDSGVYFYRVQAIERSATGRFVLVR